MKPAVAKRKSYRNTMGGNFNTAIVPWSAAEPERRQAVRAIGPAPEWMNHPTKPPLKKR